MDPEFATWVRRRVGHVRPWGAELADRAARSATLGEFQAAAFRRIQQSAQLRLGPDAVAEIWRLIHEALRREIPVDPATGQPALSKAWLDGVIDRFHPSEWWQTVAAALAARRFDYPFKKHFLDPDAMFAALQRHDAALDPAPFALRAPAIDLGVPCPTLGVFAAAADDYDAIDAVADCFTEEARLSARFGARPAVLEAWRRDDALRRRVYVDALAHRESGGDGAVTVHTLREAAFRSPDLRECTQFKPTLAKAVIRHFGATRVLDFSAGWGDRLIAALACPEVKKYHGYDPNPALAAGHAAILARWGKGRRNVKVVQAPAETARFVGKFDLVFTSPPFFDVETYTDAPGQSVHGRHSADAWLVEFLFPVLAAAWRALDPGGHLVLHLNDGRGLRLCDPAVLYCRSTLDKCDFRGVLGARGGQSGAVRPMWVFRKATAPLPAAPPSPLPLRYPRLARRFGIVQLDSLLHHDRAKVAALLGDPAVMRWIGNRRPWPRAKTDRLLDQIAADGNAGAHQHWAVTLNHRLCGVVRLRPVDYTDDIPPRLTVLVAPADQGCGVGARAARLVAEQSDEPVKAEVHPDNAASAAMLLKAGFSECAPVLIHGVEHRSFFHPGRRGL